MRYPIGSRLAILMGGYREDVAAVLPEALAPEPAAGDLPVGIPARLLQQRPQRRLPRQSDHFPVSGPFLH